MSPPPLKERKKRTILKKNTLRKNVPPLLLKGKKTKIVSRKGG